MNRRQQQNKRLNLHRENARAKKKEETSSSAAEILANARRDVAAASSAVEALRSARPNADEGEEEVEEKVEDGESMIIESDEEGDDDAPSLFDGAALGWAADDSAADLRAPGLLRDFANHDRLFNGVRRVHPLRF